MDALTAELHKRTNLSQDGVASIAAMLHPPTDSINPGYPDADNTKSIRNNTDFEFEITAPPNTTSDLWDCVVFYNPNDLQRPVRIFAKDAGQDWVMSKHHDISGHNSRENPSIITHGGISSCYRTSWDKDGYVYNGPTTSYTTPVFDPHVPKYMDEELRAWRVIAASIKSTLRVREINKVGEIYAGRLARPIERILKTTTNFVPEDALESSEWNKLLKLIWDLGDFKNTEEDANANPGENPTGFISSSSAIISYVDKVPSAFSALHTYLTALTREAADRKINSFDVPLTKTEIRAQSELVSHPAHKGAFQVSALVAPENPYISTGQEVLVNNWVRYTNNQTAPLSGAKETGGYKEARFNDTLFCDDLGRYTSARVPNSMRSRRTKTAMPKGPLPPDFSETLLFADIDLQGNHTPSAIRPATDLTVAPFDDVTGQMAQSDCWAPTVHIYKGVHTDAIIPITVHRDIEYLPHVGSQAITRASHPAAPDYESIFAGMRLLNQVPPLMPASANDFGSFMRSAFAAIKGAAKALPTVGTIVDGLDLATRAYAAARPIAIQLGKSASAKKKSKVLPKTNRTNNNASNNNQNTNRRTRRGRRGGSNK